jgi:predicted CXXCH cytochrome family protein
MNKGSTRLIRLRAVVTFPAVSVALVASIALVLTPFGPSQVVALAAVTDPTAAPTTDPTAAPTTDPTAAPTTDPAAAPTTDPAASPTIAAPTAPTSFPSPAPGLAPSLAVAVGGHHLLAQIAGPGLQATYLPVDTDVTNASQFQTFRVRFQLDNATTDPITINPQLEFRAGDDTFTVVPDNPELGIPFHLSREWVPDATGTMQSLVGEVINTTDFLMAPGSGLATTGHHSMGLNPDNAVTLKGNSYTEEEFTVGLSIDAKYLTGYQLRITDGGAPLTSDVASISLGASPLVQLSPDQLKGVDVVDPNVTSTPGVAYPLSSTPSTIAPTTPAAAISVVSAPATQNYPLTASPLSPATSATGIHGPYSTTSDQCTSCHRVHAGKTPTLLVEGSQSALCFTCHDGMGAATDVKSEYKPEIAIPANDPVTRDYYSHDALAPSGHTLSQQADDESGGVTNRHSECADCHNSHKAGTTDSTQTSTGWVASGRLAGVSGVSVVNGPNAGDAPLSYTFLDGVTKPVTLEYQLCFKCHSGFTSLLPKIEGKPSTDALDKAVELNPANASYHPVEAPGKNETDAMKASLAGTSPYKLWNFTTGSTVRCLNCHANGSTPTPQPGVDGALPTHASNNRGILLRNYQDRVLESKAKAYSAGDFALCYVCHSEEPFANSASPFNSTGTNFKFHGLHVTGLAGKGDGSTTIDKAGDGQGNAICAECHFRIHSTTNKVPQAVDGSHLVNFAPNVQPTVLDGGISWTSGTAGGGSCTLTCHGYTHNALKY